MKLDENEIVPQSIRKAMSEKKNYNNSLLNQTTVIPALPFSHSTKSINLNALLGLSDNATMQDVTEAIVDLKLKKYEATKMVIHFAVDKAYDEGKISLNQKSHFINLGFVDLLSTIDLLKEMRPNVISLNQEYEDLKKMSGEELWKNGKFDLLKLHSLERFKTKYKEFYNKDYNGQ